MGLEIFGVITGIIYVILEARQNKLLWPLGFITSAVYVWVFFDSKFYADMGLQVYYVLISVYGWFAWTRNPKSATKESERTKNSKLQVSNIPLKSAVILGIVFLGTWTLLYHVLSNYTDSTVPFGDSFTTAIAIVATWMLTRKFIEQWYLWMIANVVSIALYAYKGLYPTVILYVVYAAMSIYGYLEWRKTLVANDK